MPFQTKLNVFLTALLLTWTVTYYYAMPSVFPKDTGHTLSVDELTTHEYAHVAADRLNATQSLPMDTADTRPRILCWVLTDVAMATRTEAVRDTWTRRCDTALFFGADSDASFPIIGLPGTKAGRNHIASKAKAAWRYVYRKHLNDAEFFLKADPDTYVIVENMKAYLRSRDPASPEFFGHRFSPKLGFLNHTYMSGGPSHVMSREALRRLVTRAFLTSPDCMPDGQGEDFKTAACLHRVGARPVDTRDQEGKETFMVFHPSHLLTGVIPGWYQHYDTNGAKTGSDCCSDIPISFHYLQPREMFMMDYFMYTLSVYGVKSAQRRLQSNLHFYGKPK